MTANFILCLINLWFGLNKVSVYQQQLAGIKKYGDTTFILQAKPPKSEELSTYNHQMQPMVAQSHFQQVETSHDYRTNSNLVYFNSESDKKVSHANASTQLLQTPSLLYNQIPQSENPLTKSSPVHRNSKRRKGIPHRAPMGCAINIYNDSTFIWLNY